MPFFRLPMASATASLSCGQLCQLLNGVSPAYYLLLCPCSSVSSCVQYRLPSPTTWGSLLFLSTSSVIPVVPWAKSELWKYSFSWSHRRFFEHDQLWALSSVPLWSSLLNLRTKIQLASKTILKYSLFCVHTSIADCAILPGICYRFPC